jgi:hypothetical protein
MADDVSVVVTADSGNATEAVHDVGQAVNDLKNQVSAITEGVSAFKDRFLEAFSAQKIIEFVSAMVESASATERLQTQLGATGETIATFQLVSQAAGTSVSSISEGMTRLERTVSQANAGIDRSVDLLASLGLRASSFAGLNFDQKFDLIASKLAVMRDGTEKTAIAQQLLGGAATALLPIINRGAGALQEYNEIMQRSGVQGPPEFIESMGRIETAGIEFSASMTGLGKTLVTALAPAIQGSLKVLSDLAQNFNNAAKSGGPFKDMLDGVAIAAKGLATALVVVVGVLEVVGAALAAFVTDAARDLKGFSDGVALFLTGDFAGAKAAFANLGQTWASNMRDSSKTIATITQQMVDQLNVIWGKGAEAKEKIDQNVDANLRRRNQDAISAAMSRLDAEVRLEQEALKQKIAVLDMEVALGRMTQNQKFGAVEQYTEQAYQAELKLLQEELAIGGLKASQAQAINNKILQLQAQHTTAMVNLDRQAVQSQIQYWQQYTNTIASSINSGLRGILTGQMSFVQASKSLLLDLSLKTIELLVTKPVTEYIAGQLALLTANQTGAAARAATEVAASEAALPAKIATFTSDLTARAALTFAGIFANLAPILGPLAAGPAAAGEATVLAQAAAVPKFDVGSWSVPRTGLAVIHKDEMILPAGAPAEAARAGLLGGGGSGGAPAQVTLVAWDGQSVQRWLTNGGASQLAKGLNSYFGKNRSDRP